MTLGRLSATLAAGFLVASAGAAQADKIKNPTAVFSGLDKITGRIISFEVEVDETVQFGALQMTPRVCYSRPPTESPQTTTFVEVDEVTLENKYRRVFTGWMFASSPGLHGIEHPIYDIWLTECKGGQEVIVEAKDPDATPVPATGRDRGRRRRFRPPACRRMGGSTCRRHAAFRCSRPSSRPGASSRRTRAAEVSIPPAELARAR
jgi:hypothetical protein